MKIYSNLCTNIIEYPKNKNNIAQTNCTNTNYLLCTTAERTAEYYYI